MNQDFDCRECVWYLKQGLKVYQAADCVVVGAWIYGPLGPIGWRGCASPSPSTGAGNSIRQMGGNSKEFLNLFNFFHNFLQGK